MCTEKGPSVDNYYQYLFSRAQVMLERNKWRTYAAAVKLHL